MSILKQRHSSALSDSVKQKFARSPIKTCLLIHLFIVARMTMILLPQILHGCPCHATCFRIHYCTDMSMQQGTSKSACLRVSMKVRIVDCCLLLYPPLSTSLLLIYTISDIVVALLICSFMSLIQLMMVSSFWLNHCKIWVRSMSPSLVIQ